MPPHPPERQPAVDRLSPAQPAEDLDAREFEAFARGQDALDIEAATWASRSRNGLDGAGEAGLRTWLAADPRHAAAFDDLQAMLGTVRQLPDRDVTSLKAGLREAEQAAMPAISGLERRGPAGLVLRDPPWPRCAWAGAETLTQWQRIVDTPDTGLAERIVQRGALKEVVLRQGRKVSVKNSHSQHEDPAQVARLHR